MNESGKEKKSTLKNDLRISSDYVCDGLTPGGFGYDDFKDDKIIECCRICNGFTTVRKQNVPAFEEGDFEFSSYAKENKLPFVHNDEGALVLDLPDDEQDDMSTMDISDADMDFEEGESIMEMGKKQTKENDEGRQLTQREARIKALSESTVSLPGDHFSGLPPMDLSQLEREEVTCLFPHEINDK